MSAAAPLWICFLPQLVSVLGDCFGQRSSRVYHKQSRRRFLIALVAVTSVQMFVALSIIQVAAPSVTTPITEKRNGTTYDFCDTEEGRHSELCYSQGPLTIYRALDLCPMLLLDGVLNVVYYLGEATMYKQSLGVLLLVLCALTSSFIVAPMQSVFGLKHGAGPGAGPIVMGITGALMCLIERKAATAEGAKDEDVAVVSPNAQVESSGRSQSDLESLGTLQRTGSSGSQGSREVSPLVEHSAPTCADRWLRRAQVVGRQALSHLPLLVPFFALSFTYALYFVLMDYYNSQCKMNVFGYNSFDQVTLPLYVFPMFAIVDAIAPCKRALEAELDQHETFIEACRGAFVELFSNRGAGFFNMFFYRLLINARAMAYTYIATSYNLAASYLELTLIRVIVSWMASLLLVLLIPRFILTDPAEQAQMKDKVNIGLKLFGTGAILGSLFLIHEETS